MAQLSLYLTEPTMERLRANAKRRGASVSKYVSELINQADQTESWPDGYWDSVYGALKDPSFVVPSELDPSLDGPLVSFD